MAALDADLASGLRYSERQDKEGELQLEYTILVLRTSCLMLERLAANGNQTQDT